MLPFRRDKKLSDLRLFEVLSKIYIGWEKEIKKCRTVLAVQSERKIFRVIMAGRILVTFSVSKIKC